MNIRSLSEFNEFLNGIVDEFPSVIQQVNTNWQASVEQESLRLVVSREFVLRLAVLFSQPPEQAIKLVPELR